MTDKDIMNLHPQVFYPLWKRSPLFILTLISILTYLIFSINYFIYDFIAILNHFVSL